MSFADFAGFKLDLVEVPRLPGEVSPPKIVRSSSVDDEKAGDSFCWASRYAVSKVVRERYGCSNEAARVKVKRWKADSTPSCDQTFLRSIWKLPAYARIWVTDNSALKALSEVGNGLDRT